MRNVIWRSMILLLAGALLLFPLQSTTANAAEVYPIDKYFPTDIEEHWAYFELDDFVSADLLKGYEYNGEVTLKPNNSISRAQFVAILVRALDLTSNQTGISFKDVKADEWFYEPIRIASSLGIVSGVSKTQFGPEKTITRADIAVMIVRAFKATVDMPETVDENAIKFKDMPNNYARTPIGQANAVGIIAGKTETEFKPFNKATRAEAVVMLSRALRLEESNLTAHDVLFKVIKDADKAAMDTMNAGSYDKLDEASEPYYTGYQAASNLEDAEFIQILANDGVDFSIEEVSQSKLTVLFESDRFVVIEAKEGSYKLTMSDDKSQTVETVSEDGIIKMKKMNNNQWKIYEIIPQEEE